MATPNRRVSERWMSWHSIYTPIRTRQNDEIQQHNLDELINYKMTMAQALSNVDHFHLVAEKAAEENLRSKECIKELSKLVKSLRKQVESDQEKNKVRDEENESLKNDVNILQYELNDSITRCEELVGQNKVLDEENRSLKKDVNRLQCELNDSVARCEELVNQSKIASVEDHNDQACMFNFEQDPDHSVKKCPRCFEIGVNVEAIVQDHFVEDKLDPKEVEDAFKQIRRQSFKSLKKARSKSLELELNCKMLESSRDRWQKQADGLGKEIIKVSMENKRLRDKIISIEQHMQTNEKSYSSGNVLSCHSSMKSEGLSTPSLLGWFRQQSCVGMSYENDFREKDGKSTANSVFEMLAQPEVPVSDSSVECQVGSKQAGKPQRRSSALAA